LKEEFIIKILDKAMDFITQDQALQLRTILEEELYHCELQAATVALVPVNNIQEKVKLFLATKKLDGLSENTLISYKRILGKFSRVLQKDLESINAMDIRMYLAMYAKTGVKNSSMATIISTLKSFFTWLENEEYLIKSPMRKVKTIKTDKYIRKALTPVELEMLRVVCGTVREKAMVEFFYSTGCRLEEAQKLNKHDIDWNTGKIIVIGKGKKERVVFLNAKAKVHLWKYLNSRKDINEALFVGERQPHARLGRRSFQTTFGKLGRNAGITKEVYPHLLRHTMATNMLQNGASLAEVQKYLGHTSPATTQIYAQLDSAELQQSHKKHVI
jgi:integrase/recombinase XerD